ncbi:RNA-dependent RNA polymerase [Vigna unguiculata]|uniref:RNA-dependent RNA polymerase n=1 Tax=Vigna unguiculata TaxID=3917 RepID=A0A4D6L4Y0_VIGUN|nr:RNA-dependent RNA polymerase [Vigna unguiculata]
MGSTCKQGKPNGNQKREGTTLIDIGQKMIQKAKAHPAEIGSTSDKERHENEFFQVPRIRKDMKMNFSSLCRAIRLAKRIDRSILKSIVTPSTGLPRQSQLKNEIVALSKDLILRGYVGSQLGKRDLSGGRKGEKTRGGIFYPTICVMKSFGSPGRLSQSTEAGAGKRQIFAIGHFVNKRVLKPLHDFLMDTLRSIPMDGTFHQLRPWPLSLKTNHLIRTFFGGKSFGDCLDAIFSRSMKYPFFAQFEIRCTQDSALLGMPFLETMRQVACFQAGPAARKRSLSVLTWISGDGIRRPEATSSRGRSLALGDRLVVSLATAKRLPSAKDSFLSQQEDARLHLKELTRLTLPRLSQGLVSGSSSNLSHLSRMRGNPHVRFLGGRASRNHPIPIANIWSSI